MVFYGASGHGKVVVDAWTASGGSVTAIVDDNETIAKLGAFSVSGKYDEERFKGEPLIISIGQNAIRKIIVERLEVRYGKVIHPSAVISSSALLNEGCVVMGCAVVNAAAFIGKHVILNTGAVVDHDCRIADFVHVSPRATLCGGVEIGEGTQVGAGATVIPNIKIGKWAVIGAGSVIIEDVPDYAVVVGVPGKIKKSCKPDSV
jgi:sugar O-acyltransferase (sialic acid O-acetyltransferase NeuD family)